METTDKSFFRELNDREKTTLITFGKNDCKKLLILAGICLAILIALIISTPSIARWLNIEITPIAIIAIGIGIAGLAVLAVFRKNKQMLNAVTNDMARCYDDKLIEIKPVVSNKRKNKKQLPQTGTKSNEYIPFSPHTREDLPVGSDIVILVWNINAATKKLIFDATLFK